MAKASESQQIQFLRLIKLRNDLDKTENRATIKMLREFDKGIAEINSKLKRSKAPGTKAQKKKLQKELKKTYKVLAKKLEGVIVSGGAEVFKEGTQGMYDILSWSGLDPTIKQVKLPANSTIEKKVASYTFGDIPISGWIEQVFGSVEELQGTIIDSYKLGEGYPKMIQKILGPYSNITKEARDEMITLARTTTQQSAIQSELAMFEENAEVIKAVRWTAVMEIGYVSSGKGTCPRCAALDGQEYKTNDKGQPINSPPMTLHPRCRCMWVPVTKTWNELFAEDGLIDKTTGEPLEMSEAEDVYRTFKDRAEANVDTGRKKGNVLEYVEAGGTYGDFVENKPGYLLSTFGPNRARLVEEGKLTVADFVNSKTGELFTLKQLGFPIGAKDKEKG